MALPFAPLGVLVNRKFFRSMTKGLIPLSARLLLSSSLPSLLHLLRGDSFRDGTQSVGVLLVACHIGGFRFLCFRGGEYLSFFEQKAKLLHDRRVGLLGGCAEPLVPGKAQGFRQQRYLTFQTRNTLVLRCQSSVLFLIFCPENGHHFWVVCLKIIRTFHVLSILYFS